MLDYDEFKGYIHSRHLRWSAGSTKGRPADWQDDAQVLAPQEIAMVATTAGFGAAYVDRAGYADHGAAVDAALTQLTGAGPAFVSADGRLDWYDLRPLAASVARTTTPSERHVLRDALILPVELDYGPGFSFQEFDAGGPFRWGAADARLKVDNPQPVTRRMRLTATLFGGGAAPSTVLMTLPDGRRRTLTVSAKGAPLDVTFAAEPGARTVHFQTTGPAAPNAPNNIRDQRLRVSDPRLRDQQLAPGLLAKLIAAAKKPA
jgi:phosphoglycerol transferase